jgi:hypothetical protein
LNTPDVEIPKPEYTVKIDETEDDTLYEAIFAMTMLMNNLDHLRAEISSLWTQYNEDKDGADIAAIAVATNTAIDLVCSFEEELQPLMDSQGGTTTFHKRYLASVAQAFLGVDVTQKQQAQDPYNLAAFELGESLLAHTMMYLEGFARKIIWAISQTTTVSLDGSMKISNGQLRPIVRSLARIWLPRLKC